MPNTSILSIAACALVLAAAGADYGVGRMDVPKPHRLPVESFPATVGVWKGGPLREPDLDITRTLPTAKIVERVYTNPFGQQVDLMLLTATEDEDMHSPQVCFPAQGWNLSNIQTVQADGDPATRMTAELSGQRQMVLYWLTGYYPPPVPRNPIVRTVAALRARYIERHKNMSLFVRLIASEDPVTRQAVSEFIVALHPPLSQLKSSLNVAPERHMLPYTF